MAIRKDKPKRPVNPFFTKIDIPDEYFCDRDKETGDIINYIENGKNIVLKAQRRMGKSSLAMHVFKQKYVAENYNTLYIDIFGTKNMPEFIREMKNAFFDAPFAKTEKGRKTIENLFKGIQLKLGVGPEGIGLSIGSDPKEEATYTLSEMFRFLEKTSKPNIIVLDEFQKINEYPEDAAAIIRSYVQKCNNTHFIFSGSSRHMLSRMFEDVNEPFYRSATGIELKPIPQKAYTEFCRRLFNEYDKNIEDDAIKFCYELFSGNTFDIQEVMNETFMHIEEGHTVTINDVGFAVDLLLDQHDSEFKEKLDRIDNEKTRKVLTAIAYEGIATGLTSADKIARYGLGSSSSVQNCVNYLTNADRNLVTRIGRNGLQIHNRYFELWLARRYGFYNLKLKDAGKRYELERKANEEFVPTFKPLIKGKRLK